MDLVESRPERGEYKLTVSAALDKPESNIISPATAVFSIHVLTSAAIDFVDIGAVDADQTTQGKLERFVPIYVIRTFLFYCPLYTTART